MPADVVKTPQRRERNSAIKELAKAGRLTDHRRRAGQRNARGVRALTWRPRSQRNGELLKSAELQAAISSQCRSGDEASRRSLDSHGPKRLARHDHVPLFSRQRRLVVSLRRAHRERRPARRRRLPRSSSRLRDDQGRRRRKLVSRMAGRRRARRGRSRSRPSRPGGRSPRATPTCARTTISAPRSSSCSGSDPRKKDSYVRSVACFHAALPCFDNPPERVTFPFEGSHLSAATTTARSAPRGSATRRSPISAASTSSRRSSTSSPPSRCWQRGFGVLCFDGPGMGEPLRVRGIHARPDYEVAISAAVDYLVEPAGRRRRTRSAWSASRWAAITAAAARPTSRACAPPSFGAPATT